MSVNAPPHGLLGFDDHDLSAPNVFAAHRSAGSRMRAQWSGRGGPAAGGRESGAEKVESRHGGPPPPDAGFGPLRRGGRMDADWVIGPSDLAAHWGGDFRMDEQAFEKFGFCFDLLDQLFFL